MSNQVPVLEDPVVADQQPCGAPITDAPVDADTAPELAAAFKALGDPVRLRLLSMIASAPGGEACVCELTPVFDLTGPTISHHLKYLRESGLVTSERRGTWVFYRAVRPKLALLSALLAEASLER